jgi:hypothetical protein
MTEDLRPTFENAFLDSGYFSEFTANIDTGDIHIDLSWSGGVEAESWLDGLGGIPGDSGLVIVVVALVGVAAMLVPSSTDYLYRLTAVVHTESRPPKRYAVAARSTKTVWLLVLPLMPFFSPPSEEDLARELCRAILIMMLEDGLLGESAVEGQSGERNRWGRPPPPVAPTR